MCNLNCVGPFIHSFILYPHSLYIALFFFFIAYAYTCIYIYICIHTYIYIYLFMYTYTFFMYIYIFIILKYLMLLTYEAFLLLSSSIWPTVNLTAVKFAAENLTGECSEQGKLAVLVVDDVTRWRHYLFTFPLTRVAFSYLLIAYIHWCFSLFRCFTIMISCCNYCVEIAVLVVWSAKGYFNF